MAGGRVKASGGAVYAAFIWFLVDNSVSLMSLVDCLVHLLLQPHAIIHPQLMKIHL